MIKTDEFKTASHAMGADACLTALKGRPAGLSEKEANQRLQQYGQNRLPEPPPSHPALRFLSHFHNVFIYVLLGSALITAALGHFIDAGVILAVVLGNAVIGFVQEGRAEQAMNAIRQMLTPKTSVVREGKRRTVDSNFVVPGDVVLLEPGEKVPADLRLLETAGLRIEEAILTGESVPVNKATQPVAVDASLGDRSCLAFSGTLVTGGAGRGVVVATGAATEIGRISGMLSKVKTLTTPLTRQMDAFARWLTIFILLIAVILLVYGYFISHLPFAELFLSIVGLSVAAIPEGLPAVLTITLAVGVQAMARRNAIVRRLPAIETIGSVSVICSDKTGTLTRNEMTVVSLVSAGHAYSVSGEGYAPEGDILRAGEAINPAVDEELREFALASYLCNDAVLQAHKNDWKIEGDPMEGALKALSGKIMRRGPDPFPDWNRTDTIPFDSAHSYMAVLHHDHEGHGRIHVKGAPERILHMCSHQRTTDGQSRPLDSAYWNRQISEMTAQGQRVLALAACSVPQDHLVLNMADLVGRPTFIGLVGLMDPPRPEAIAAVAECGRAGIRVKMITGDHAGTAAAVARQIGLQNPHKVLTGAHLETIGDAELAALVPNTDVFARTSPEHKLRLVTALQSHGLTVAMTGDGVNDAPALKRADAGIAMGRKGSEAAKEASDLVLADDNFASIVAAVREGRTVYDNIKKVISWTLPTNAGEAMTIVVALFAGLALPVSAVQILWINLVTAVTLGLALAFEPTEKGAMEHPPRPRNESLLNAQLIWHVILVSTLFLGAAFGMYTYAIDKGYPQALAQTIALNTIVVLEIFHLFFIRNIHGTSLNLKTVRGTRVVWACVVTVTLAQFAVTYLPPLQRVLGTRGVPLLDGMLIVAVGMVFFAVIESEKQLRLIFKPKADRFGTC